MFMFKVKRCCLVSNIQSILYWNYIYKLNKNHHLNLCRLKYAFFFISFVLRASSFFLFKLWPKHEKRNLFILQQLQKLKSENEKLKSENRALTRVVSKLTAAATKTGSQPGPARKQITQPRVYPFFNCGRFCVRLIEIFCVINNQK